MTTSVIHAIKDIKMFSVFSKVMVAIGDPNTFSYLVSAASALILSSFGASRTVLINAVTIIGMVTKSFQQRI